MMVNLVWKQIRLALVTSINQENESELTVHLDSLSAEPIDSLLEDNFPFQMHRSVGVKFR